jgi:hypothetical protein
LSTKERALAQGRWKGVASKRGEDFSYFILCLSTDRIKKDCCCCAGQREVER